MVEALISKTYLPTKVTMNETRGSLGVHAAPQLVKDYGGAWTEWSVEELIARHTRVTWSRHSAAVFGERDFRKRGLFL